MKKVEIPNKDYRFLKKLQKKNRLSISSMLSKALTHYYLQAVKISLEKELIPTFE